MYAVGGTSLRDPVPEVLQQLQQLALPASPAQKLVVFYKLQKGPHIYFSSSYSRVKARNSYTIVYSTGCSEHVHYGQIQYFLAIENTKFAVVHRLQIVQKTSTLFSLPFASLDSVILPVSTPTPASVELVNVWNILDKCIYIDVSTTCSAKYVIIFCKVSMGD